MRTYMSDDGIIKADNMPLPKTPSSAVKDAVRCLMSLGNTDAHPTMRSLVYNSDHSYLRSLSPVQFTDLNEEEHQTYGTQCNLIGVIEDVSIDQITRGGINSFAVSEARPLMFSDDNDDDEIELLDVCNRSQIVQKDSFECMEWPNDVSMSPLPPTMEHSHGYPFFQIDQTPANDSMDLLSHPEEIDIYDSYASTMPSHVPNFTGNGIGKDLEAVLPFPHSQPLLAIPPSNLHSSSSFHNQSFNIDSTNSLWKMDFEQTHIQNVVSSDESTHFSTDIWQNNLSYKNQNSHTHNQTLPTSPWLNRPQPLSPQFKTEAPDNNQKFITHNPKQIKSLKSTSMLIVEDRKRGRWSQTEDMLLAKAVDEDVSPAGRINWTSISKYAFQGTRNAIQCKTHWTRNLNPDVNRGKFTTHEDKVIVESMRNGMTFAEIARLLPRRSSDQVRYRFCNALDPSRKVKKNIPWSPAEKRILFESQRVLGNKWSMIASLLPGRSDNDVKNFWYNFRDSSRRALNRQRTDRKQQKLACHSTTGDDKIFPIESDSKPPAVAARIAASDSKSYMDMTNRVDSFHL